MNYCFSFNIVVCVCFFSTCVLGANRLEGKIDKIVQSYHNTHFFHGNVMVKQGDKIVYQNSLGLADDSFNVPHTIQSRFMIASVSKQFHSSSNFGFGSGRLN